MFGFVILNYVNYGETIGAIKNLSQQSWFDKIKIYVVENGSGNESVQELEKLKSEVDFELIISPKNLGFAKGSNLAIRRAREDQCQFIVELNSDARIIEGQENFLDVVEGVYHSKNRVALITPDIKNLDDVAQNPMDRYEFSTLKKLVLKAFFYTRIDKAYFFLRTGPLYKIVTNYVAYRYKNKKS